MSYLENIQNNSKKRVGIQSALANFYTNKLPPNSTVLDLGAGKMEFINAVKSDFKRLAVDSDNSCSNFADDGVELLIGEWNIIKNLPSKSLDLVYCSNFLAHIENDEVMDLLTTLSGLIKQNGKLILLQPNWTYAYRSYFDDITHVSIHTHNSLVKRLGLSGFEVIEVKKRFLPYSLKSKLHYLSFLINIYLHFPIKFLKGQMLIISKPL